MDNTHLRYEVAEILYNAFEQKIQNFWFLTKDKFAAIDLIAKGLQLDQLITVFDDEGQLVAVATVETTETEHAVRVPYQQFAKTFNPISAAVRTLGYRIYKDAQEGTKPNQLYVDLVAVKQGERSNGYGAQLFEKIENFAKQIGKDEIKLDVVSSNDAGKRFYENNGYEAIHYEKLNPFFQLFTKKAGFTSHSTMYKKLTK